jgi:hypothetical protein
MHCDDKRTLYVLREEIEKSLKLLQDSEYSDQNLLENFNNAVSEYLECKSSSS